MTDSQVDRQLKRARSNLKKAYRAQDSTPEEVARLEKKLELALFQKELAKVKHRG